MSDNIIRLDDHRKAPTTKAETLQHLELMSLVEDTIEQLDELGVTTRDQLMAMLAELEQITPDDVE